MQPRVEEEAALKTGCRCRRNDRGVVGLLCFSLRPFNLLCSLRLFISPPPRDFINNTFWVLPTTSALSLCLSLSLPLSVSLSVSVSLFTISGNLRRWSHCAGAYFDIGGLIVCCLCQSLQLLQSCVYQQLRPRKSCFSKLLSSWPASKIEK